MAEKTSHDLVGLGFEALKSLNIFAACGQSYKRSMIVIYNTSVIDYFPVSIILVEYWLTCGQCYKRFMIAVLQL